LGFLVCGVIIIKTKEAGMARRHKREAFGPSKKHLSDFHHIKKKKKEK